MLIPNSAFIFLRYIKLWSYGKWLFWVYKQIQANLLALLFQSKKQPGSSVWKNLLI